MKDNFTTEQLLNYIKDEIDKKEVQQALSDLVKKEEPFMVYLEADGYADGELVYDMAYCPNCDKLLTDEYDPDIKLFTYCPHCGQKLLWKTEPDRVQKYLNSLSNKDLLINLDLFQGKEEFPELLKEVKRRLD